MTPDTPQHADGRRRPVVADVAGAQDVERAMERLYMAVLRLAASLAEGAPEVKVRYEVEDVGTLADLVQQDYAVTTEDVQLPRFALRFRCAGRRALTYKAATVEEKESVRERLAQLGLECHINDLETWRYVLAVQPVVPVRLVFEPAPDRAAVRVTVYNLRRLGVERYSLEPDAITPELIEEIRKLVLREDNRFAEFTGNRVAAQVREQFQERLRRRARSREKEIEQADADRETAAPRGLTRLLKGREPARAPRPAPARARRAVQPPGPADAGDELREIEWDSAEPWSAPAPPAPAKPDRPAKPTPAPESAAAAPAKAVAGTGIGYAWLVTQGISVESTATSLGRLGPPGAAKRFTIPRVLTTGEPFRLLDREGKVRFNGRIAGEYQGVEPVVDFGMDHGCFLIEYQRGGRWVRVRPPR